MFSVDTVPKYQHNRQMLFWKKKINILVGKVSEPKWVIRKTLLIFTLVTSHSRLPLTPSKTPLYQLL